ncbi:PREDICTED: major urinary protein 5-like [Chinchilla lanigera]|uniref:major urinary protein 5-like n=1 Tax=Chinchilla lanigera TaxID=34839 RepID=UPI0006985B0D|nr:PREDICTED: major urinary protein 5-like [Chinchilla lanigera]
MYSSGRPWPKAQKCSSGGLLRRRTYWFGICVALHATVLLFFCRTDDGYNVFHIVETDYDSYAIFQLRNFKSEESFQLLELYGREPDVSPEIKKRFEEFSKENGIGEQNITDLTNVDRCLQARDGK